ncbi:hypothetical protein [Streptomyces violascens]|uniref:Uncharacterized protein n=1 Tax=Streptomyces violascens TaxID=67381 RepID=A0ABQ3QLV1_9ACTN|nr:hypothetical protein [Streptomyces violascens]GGU09799.1 hypothetical protein GCM10010289_33560 [Streptomyces violascens]GHI38238.1 hypothetical protein Sviol_26460 [Streptomyces violascens]
MSTYARTSLRAAIATAALAGAFLTPAAAFAATSAPAPAASGTCHVTKDVASVQPYMFVTLTNDLANGPKAELRNDQGKVVASVDRAHPTDLSDGIKLEEAKGGKAVFFQRSQGGDAPWTSQNFPALPKTCTDPGDATYKLVNGETLAVHRFATNHYRAEFLTNGKVVKIMETEGEDVDAFVHGMHVTLNSSTGKVNSEYINGRSGCTVTEVVPSVFHAGMSVKLTNGPEGAKASLRDSGLKVFATVDRAHPVSGQGIRVDGANTAAPKLGQRTQGGDTPYAYTDFPKLPAGCASGTAAKTPVNAPTQNGGQTTVVPKGAVAAGADIKQGGGDDTALIAGGAGLAVVAAGGYVVLRRRNAARI